MNLPEALKLAANIIGDVLVIGTGDTRVTERIANACDPALVHVIEASQADGAQLKQSKSKSPRRLRFNRGTLLEHLANQKTPIKFCFFHGPSTNVEAVVPHLLPEGILCGLGPPPENLAGVQSTVNFWSWQPTPAQARLKPRRHSKNPLHYSKRSLYYSNERKEVLLTIDACKLQPQNVVEIGCGTGAFGAKLRAKLQTARYVGIELEPDAARQAAGRLDQVHVADITTTTPAQLGITADIDLLVALDVLEHLYNPWDVLAEWVDVLRPGGHVLVSIPNIQNIKIIRSLATGNWNYSPEGLLDATHVRFFTESGIRRLLTGAGLEVIYNTVVANPRLNLSRVKDTDNVIQVGDLTLVNLSREQVVRFHAFQYIMVARKGGT